MLKSNDTETFDNDFTRQISAVGENGLSSVDIKGDTPAGQRDRLETTKKIVLQVAKNVLLDKTGEEKTLRFNILKIVYASSILKVSWHV
jgi:hypothetical protein